MLISCPYIYRRDIWQLHTPMIFATDIEFVTDIADMIISVLNFMVVNNRRDSQVIQYNWFYSTNISTEYYHWLHLKIHRKYKHSTEVDGFVCDRLQFCEKSLSSLFYPQFQFHLLHANHLPAWHNRLNKPCLTMHMQTLSKQLFFGISFHFVNLIIIFLVFTFVEFTNSFSWFCTQLLG